MTSYACIFKNGVVVEVELDADSELDAIQKGMIVQAGRLGTGGEPVIFKTMRGAIIDLSTVAGFVPVDDEDEA